MHGNWHNGILQEKAILIFKIESILLEINANATIFTHTPGFFLTIPAKKMSFFGDEVRQQQDMEVGRLQKWILNYELHELKGTYIHYLYSSSLNSTTLVCAFLKLAHLKGVLII